MRYIFIYTCFVQSLITVQQELAIYTKEREIMEVKYRNITFLEAKKNSGIIYER